MDITEILVNVARFLDRGTLVTATRVCIHWNEVFSPRLYRWISDTHSLPSPQAMARYAQHLQFLKFDVKRGHQRTTGLEAFILQPAQCCRILDLELVFDGCKDDILLWQSAALVSLNKGLKQLRISDQNGGVYLTRPCWSIFLSGCPRTLLGLVLDSVLLTNKDSEQLYILGQTLLKLEIVRCNIHADGFINSPQFPKLEALRVVGAQASLLNQLLWIQQCPNLKKLHWDGTNTRETPHAEICQGIKPHQWLHLQDLTFRNDTRRYSDTQISLMLDSCGFLRKLDVSCSKFWFRAITALERHFPTLESLSLRHCHDLQSRMCNWILRSCPRLTRFCGGMLSTHDMVVGRGSAFARLKEIKMDSSTDAKKLQQEIAAHEVDVEDENLGGQGLIKLMAECRVKMDLMLDHPWVCSGLEHLETKVSSKHATSRGWDLQVFRELSKLKQLRHLDIWYVGNSNNNSSNPTLSEESLYLDLPSGLDQLSSLGQLRRLLFGGTGQKMVEEDVLWILKQWPHLAEISSNFNTDKDISAKLRKLVVDSNSKITLR
ncbi:hypothetical protein BGZ83_002583 [Gryganskiella cystojenkinii]|nr:hypothetical protein BGZ83_002583 [Gryganskiella cystojenkinii]